MGLPSPPVNGKPFIKNETRIMMAFALLMIYLRSLFNSFQHYSMFFRGWPAKTKKKSLPTKDPKIIFSGHFWLIRRISKKSGEKSGSFFPFLSNFFSTPWEKNPCFHGVETRIFFPWCGKKNWQKWKKNPDFSRDFLEILRISQKCPEKMILWSFVGSDFFFVFAGHPRKNIE